MASNPKLNFAFVEHDAQIPKELKNTFAIQGNEWDDYGSKVRFDLFWMDARGRKHSIGKTKILQRRKVENEWVVSTRSIPPKQFLDDIGQDYISLGQSEQYYRSLRDKFGAGAESILSALRDVAIRPGLEANFETSSVFRNGMMRENAAKRSRRFGAAWLRGEDPVEKPSFDYICHLTGDKQSFRVSFNFRGMDILPGRVVGIIGRNAVGKTRFLAQLGADLAQTRKLSAETVENRQNRFPIYQPIFNRIIAVSYSAFDRFSRPAAHDESSYVYCGIRDEKGNLSQIGLQRSFQANKKRVRALNRDHDWMRHIGRILGGGNGPPEAELRREIDSQDEDSELLGTLSSGQAILCHFVTGLLGWLQQDSLVLFDEPETHLHPNAVANLFVVLTEILHEHRSYAVAATHSPIVIQEIPSNRVLLFTRDDNSTFAEPLQFESFGENVAELTEHVFKTQEAESLYREVLDNISTQMNLENALALFCNKLSLNAKAYLLARYAQRAKR